MCAKLNLLCRAAAVILAVGLADSPCHAAHGPIVLENDRVSLELDPAFGTIARILDKSSGIALAPAAGLAENFRLVLLMPGKKRTTILGKDQKLSGVSRTPDSLALGWDQPLKDTAGAEHRIDVRMDVTAAGNALEFRLTSGQPHGRQGEGSLVSDDRRAGRLRRAGKARRWRGSGSDDPTGGPRRSLFLSARRPLAIRGRANLSFTCVESGAAKKSLYFAAHDVVARHKVYDFEEHAQGKAKDVFACIQHFPFTPPGKAFDGSTVVLAASSTAIGGPRAGCTGRGSTKHSASAKPADCWIRRQSFFQMTMFELPEGTINYRFKDIPQWAKDARDHGIHAVQISGWHLGGHDNGYPYYTVDPRLGTWQELEDGIKACHRMGLKVYFFVNYQQVMVDCDWYKKDLIKYREYKPDGDLTWNAGWGMGTLWARMDHPKRMTWVDLAFPQYRKIIVDQFARLARIGADGVHVDKMFPTAIDYNPNLPMSPDAAPWEGAILLTKEVVAACRKHNPDWAMSFECNWDRLLQFSDASWWVGNQRITRQVFPEHVETLLVASAYDYLGVNNAVREGHTVMLGPLNFCRSVGGQPWQGLATTSRKSNASKTACWTPCSWAKCSGTTACG